MGHIVGVFFLKEKIKDFWALGERGEICLDQVFRYIRGKEGRYVWTKFFVASGAIKLLVASLNVFQFKIYCFLDLRMFHCIKMTFSSVNNDQLCEKLRVYSPLLNKSLIKNFDFCEVFCLGELLNKYNS